ncbi:MAG: isochorismatase family protein [Actinomycetota bacterium]|nr:isochorismatase family protein [Actinomycetota bacterium]
MAGIPTIESYPMPTAQVLPANTPSWSVDPARAVLLVHDMQRYFLQPFPAALRAELIGNVARLRQHCVAAGVPVAYTTQSGDMTPSERGLLVDFWGAGMRRDEAERAVVEPLGPDQNDWVFAKWRYSAFFKTGLLERMREHGRDQLIVCGVYAHIGVLTSTVEAFSNDIQTFLVADAVADFSEDEHWQAVSYAAKRCAVVLTTDQLCR